MKKVIFYALVLMVIINNTVYALPSINAESAILVDAESMRVLFEYNSYAKLPMASTTKIMTALIALEKGNINDMVRVDRDAVGIEGSSIYLYEDEIISLEDLLYGLMLRSGNDAAMAIGKHIAGDIENFVKLMNEKAEEIGANNTNFTNPHGLHDDNHYTTAYDLALITSRAMEVEKFKEISKTKSWIANREKNNIFYNKNKTLWEYEGGDGVKTGYTTKAGRCLVASATRNGMKLIAVVLNDYNWFNDCYVLMDYGFNNYKPYVILERGQFIKKIPVIYGNKDEVNAVIDETFMYPLKKEELNKIKIDYIVKENIIAPINKGDILGYVNIYLDGILIYKGSIVADKDIKELNTIKKIIEKIKSKF